MSDKLQQIIQMKLEALAAEITDLARAQVLEEVSAYLSGKGAAPAAPKAKRVKRAKSAAPKAPKKRQAKKAAPAAKGTKKRRTAADVEAMASRIQKHVKANPGQSAEQIKATLGIAKNEWLRPIGKLTGEKRVKTRGRLRATKYFPGKK